MKQRLASIAILLLVSAPAAWPQTVYRCPGGYSQEPCAGGTALEGDERTPEQRQQSRSVAERDAKLADRLERERRREEAQPVSAYLPPARTPPAAKDAKKTGTASKPATRKPAKPAG